MWFVAVMFQTVSDNLAPFLIRGFPRFIPAHIEFSASRFLFFLNIIYLYTGSYNVCAGDAILGTKLKLCPLLSSYLQ